MEISKVMEKPVLHKSVVHVALTGTVGYEPFFERRVCAQEQIGRRVSGLGGELGVEDLEKCLLRWIRSQTIWWRSSE